MSTSPLLSDSTPSTTLGMIETAGSRASASPELVRISGLWRDLSAEVQVVVFAAQEVSVRCVRELVEGHLGQDDIPGSQLLDR